ncbi:tetratricopeptide repeat protein [candidate division KSB1 bacterium]|nr:tetratricopeptide repeat protein [candidate division KSB1 bacterium]
MFLVINILVTLFFIFMIYFSFQSRTVSLLLINLLGFILIGFVVVMEVNGKEDKYATLLILLVLLGIFLTDFLISFNSVGKLKFYRLAGFNDEITFTRGSFTEIVKVNTEPRRLEQEMNASPEKDVKIRQQAFTLAIEGHLALIEQHYVRAVTQYQASLALLPTSYIYLNCGAAHLCQNAADLALADFKAALQLRENLTAAWINQSTALSRLKKTEAARQSLDQAAKHGAAPDEIWLYKGTLYFKTGQIENAFQDYENALEIRRDFDAVWFQKGLCHNKMENYTAALDCFNKVIHLNRDHYQAYYYRGNVLNRLERYQEAILNYKKALKIRPQYNEAWNNLGIALCKLDRLREAFRCYEKALKIKADYYEAWYNQAVALERAGFPDRAIFNFQKFIEFAPKQFQGRIETTQKRIQDLQKKLYPADGFWHQREHKAPSSTEPNQPPAVLENIVVS